MLGAVVLTEVRGFVMIGQQRRSFHNVSRCNTKRDRLALAVQATALLKKSEENGALHEIEQPFSSVTCRLWLQTTPRKHAKL